MVLHQDYKELLNLLNQNKVEYLVVGAYALSFYGFPRNTGDIDVWVGTEEENAKKMAKTLSGFGFSSLGFSEKDFLEKNTVIQLGVPPVRIDILTSVSGLEFNEAYKNRKVFDTGELRINYISKEDFIKNKKASGRLKDLADIESLTL